jgi:hypothetical protein
MMADDPVDEDKKKPESWISKNLETLNHPPKADEAAKLLESVRDKIDAVQKEGYDAHNLPSPQTPKVDRPSSGGGGDSSRRKTIEEFGPRHDQPRNDTLHELKPLPTPPVDPQKTRGR